MKRREKSVYIFFNHNFIMKNGESGNDKKKNNLESIIKMSLVKL